MELPASDGQAERASSKGAPNVAFRPRWVLLLFIAAFLILHTPEYVTSYAMTDDYVLLSQAKQGKLLSNSAAALAENMPGKPGLMSAVASGRGTGALVLWAGFGLFHDVESLRYMRLIAVLLSALIAFSLYRASTRVGWPPQAAFALGFLICTTLPFQCFTGWSICFNALFSVVMAALAHHWIRRALDEPGRKRWWLVGGSVGMLFLAGTIYQVTMMFFVVFAAIDLFRPGAPRADFLRRVIWQTLVLGAAIILGFLFFKLCVAQWGEWMDLKRTKIVDNIPEKLDYFMRGPLADALQLGKLWPTDYLSIAVGSFIVIGLCLYFEGGVLARLARLGLALVMVPGIYLPNLASAENWGAFRTQFSLTALLMVYAFLALHGFARLAGRARARIPALVLPVAALISGIAAAHNLITYFIEPQMTEVNIVQSQLARVDLHKLKKIYIAGAAWYTGIVDVRYDEFGTPSSSKWFAEPAMVYVLATERYGYAPPVEQSPGNLPSQPPAGVYLVNMTRMDLFR